MFLKCKVGESIGYEVQNWPNHSWYKHPKKKQLKSLIVRIVDWPDEPF